MFSIHNATYVYDSGLLGFPGWVPLEYGTAPIARGITVLSRTYGVTSPFDSTQTEVSAARVGPSFVLDPGPNPSDPHGLFTISTTYAVNAAGTSTVPTRTTDETAATLAPVVNGSLRVASLTYAYNGTNFVRALTADETAATLAPVASGSQRMVAPTYAYDGANFVRALTGSPANLATLSPVAAQLVQGPGEWSVPSTPAANTQATAARAAVAGQRNICKSITATYIGLAGSVENTVLVNLRDGASGAGTILWSTRLLVTGTTASQTGVSLSNLNIIGSVNTVMTLEFAAAGGASTFEAVAITGVTA